MMTVQQLDVLRDQLKQELSSSSSNLQKVGQLLTQAKVNFMWKWTSCVLLLLIETAVGWLDRTWSLRSRCRQD